MSRNTGLFYEFDSFRLDLAEHQLLREGRPVPLEPKVFQMLAVLVERGGRLVGKDELMKALWPDSFVEESNLTRCVWKLRNVLGESKDGPRYIETVPKRGYRFTAEVRELPAAHEELRVETHSITRTVTEEEQVFDVTDTLADSRALPQFSSSRSPARLSLVLSLAALLAIGTAAVLYRSSTSHATENARANVARGPQLRTLAVLPFDTIGSEPGNEYLGLGLADALITKLGNVQQIVVRPTSAVRRYANGKRDAIAAGREQGVDAVLGGTVQRMGDRIRVNVQLIRVADGATLWAEKFDGQFKDIFSTQDEISEQVWCDFVTHICDGSGIRHGREKQIKIEAYEAYLKGRYFWGKRDAEGVRKGIEYFKQAVAIEPDYAEGHAALGGATMFGTLFGMSASEANSKGRAETQKALELDPNLAEAHANLGLISMNYDWDWATAERELNRAMELSPSNPIIHDWYAEYLNEMGRHDEAVAEIERARELDPLSAIVNSDKCKLLHYARRYTEAVQQCKRTLELDPAFDQALSWLAASYWEAGLHQEALAAESERLALKLNPSEKLEVQAVIDIWSGKTDEARKIIKQLEQPAKTGEVESGEIALFYIYLGDNDQALAWLERAYAMRSVYMALLKAHPRFDTLRSDPRFVDLVKRVGLAD